MKNSIAEEQIFKISRNNMVQNQIIPNNITDDAILDALKTAPKHLLVDIKFQDVAYSESSISVGHGRFILEPVVFAKMLQACAIKKADIVLDVGCGLGYSSFVLSMLSKKVIAIESEVSLVIDTKHNLNQLEVENCIVHSNSLSYGYPDNALYDVIFVNGAFRKVPALLFEQLSNEGRLAIIEKTPSGTSMAVVYKKHREAFDRQEICYVSINYLE